MITPRPGGGLVIRKPRVRTKVLVVGLPVAVIACGRAAAAMPTFWLQLRAHLGPVAGTTAAGRFNGVLARSGLPSGRTALPRYAGVWRLRWTPAAAPAVTTPKTKPWNHPWVVQVGGAPSSRRFANPF
jgi:hypothetical protein